MLTQYKENECSCPKCQTKYCATEGHTAILLKDMPLKEGVKLEESS